jgi:DNA-directed RNA polymerase specialized sigma24 family protein
VRASGNPSSGYFQGRSSLATWLRAVLAQRYVDRIRASRRTEPPADEESVEGDRARRRPVLGQSNPEKPRCRAAVADALHAALDALARRDRWPTKATATSAKPALSVARPSATVIAKGIAKLGRRR